MKSPLPQLVRYLAKQLMGYLSKEYFRYTCDLRTGVTSHERASGHNTRNHQEEMQTTRKIMDETRQCLQNPYITFKVQ